MLYKVDQNDREAGSNQMDQFNSYHLYVSSTKNFQILAALSSIHRNENSEHGNINLYKYITLLPFIS